MLLKTYSGRDLATALGHARAELGPDALVLGTTERTGRLGLPVVEVTVGAPRGANGSDREVDPTVQQLSAEVRELRRLLPRPGTDIGVGPSRSTRPVEPNPGVIATVDALVAGGLSRDLAERFSRMTAGSLCARSLAEATALNIRELVPFAPVPTLHRCTFVVGPPGCGKTTTVAKLAARAAAPQDRPVFFAEADGDRIGSFEQAEIFSRHIGSGLARITEPADLHAVLRDAGSDGVVIVDTPGIGSRDDERSSGLAELRRQVPDATVVLLVPAGLHRAEVSCIIDRFEPLGPTCVGFSRVDDARVPGELVTALAPHRLPLSFFTNGIRVPDDLEVASPHGLAALLLRAGGTARPSRRLFHEA